ncbi:MAG: CDP-alcohol phosphatidyltransferase family protein [Thermaurantiacus sp.]
MPGFALLSVGEAPPGEVPPGLRVAAGRTLVERQLRQLLHETDAELLLLAPAVPDRLARWLASQPRVRCVATPEALARHLAGRVDGGLVLAPGLLIDERLIRAMARAAPGPAMLVFSGTPPEGALRLDSGTHSAGLIRLPAPLISRTALQLGDWDLGATLERAAVEAGARRIAVESLDRYDPPRRRELPFLWARPESVADCRAATSAVIAAAQKGCLDWPARFLHPPVENLLVRLLLPTRITPNMVTLLTAILGIGALAAFLIGQPLVGLGLVLLIGPLDGVDGKLARARVEYSRWGDLEHVLDKILEYGWFLAIGFWLAAQGHGIAAWLAAGGIIVFALAEATQGEFFRRFTGRQLDDWGPFERRWRLVAGRRNTFFWSLVPFAAFGLWFEGFLMILGYALLTFAVAQWRFLKALGEHGRAVSDTVRASFAATSYAFLPKSGGGSSGVGLQGGRLEPAEPRELR